LGDFERARAEEAVALVLGDITVRRLWCASIPVPTGDVFARCAAIAGSSSKWRSASYGTGAGILLYEQQEGRDCLMAKLQAYASRTNGLDTVEANENWVQGRPSWLELPAEF